MRLFLVQHAAAASKQEDASRPITEQGRAVTDRVAAWLAESDACRPAEIRHSGKLRARQTAERFAEALGCEQVNEVAGLAPLDEVAPCAQSVVAEERDLMLVGHLPHLARLASLLVYGDFEAGLFDFRNSGVLCLRRAAGKWTVAWLVVPELLAEA